MKKLAAIALGAALMGTAVTATPQQAKADAPLLLLGGIAIGAAVVYHHYINPSPSSHSVHVLNPFSWKHIHWCKSHYKTYNPDTDLYYYAPGLQRQCVSPYSG